jgi:phosphate transport system substrate-binding protein
MPGELIVLLLAILCLAACCLLPVQWVRRSALSILLLTAVLTEALFGGLLLLSSLGTPGGWLTLILSASLLASGLLWIWKPFTRRRRTRVTCALLGAALLAACAAAAPQIRRHGVAGLDDLERRIELKDYEPFTGHSRAATLGAPASLALAGDLPRIDGATALYPLYAAFVQNVYPPGEYDVSGYLERPGLRDGATRTLVACGSTRRAFENLLEGAADVAFLADVSDRQREEARERGVDLRLTPIGREAFVFFVNARNPVSGLTSAEVRGIYSGAIVNWREVGGDDSRIQAYQRVSGSGSQTALERVMGGVPLAPPVEEERFDLMSGMRDVVADYREF